LETLYGYFDALDRISDKDKTFAFQAMWQLLLDDKGYPGTKPPWGLLTAIDLNTGKKVWQVPLGQHDELLRNGAPVRGQRNHGGIVVTAGGLVFATGTLDNKIRAFDSANGAELWSFKLPAAGSAPPMTYRVDGAQYVVVMATGGLFHGYSGRSDKMVAFKLPETAR
jgi:quinoprotein glucose dehydrogenase